MVRHVALSLMILFSCSLAAQADDAPFSSEQLEFFEKEVRPILVARCYECHSASTKEPKGGLRVDGRSHLLTGGDTGPAIDLKNPAKSLLLDAVNYGETYQMPPKTRLPAEEVATLTKWVTSGAAWPKETAEVAKKAEFDLPARKAAHWCWRPLANPTPPEVKNAAWPQDELDRFILARLEQNGWTPAAPTAKHTLLRRLYFDLIGLPPSPEKIAAFEADQSAEAVAKVVDELLASPQFGERWGRHWLDLVRYAESRGHEFDYNAPNAYQYRDYVIRALNADLPYHQFLREHLAGDLLPQPRLNRERGFDESILGTGFWFLGEWVHSPVDIRKDEADRYDNMIDVMSKSMLGLTVACARCHDHKFDAISQKDYYALFGYLQSTAYRLVRFDTMLSEEEQARELAALETRYATAMNQAVAASYPEATTAQLSSYLLAAREVGLKREGIKLSTPTKEQPADISEEDRGAIRQIAQEKQLDATRLEAWVKYLLRAESDPRDMFHTWSKLLRVRDEGGFTATLKQREDYLKRRAEEIVSFPRQAEIICDFRDPTATLWRNGVSFGLAPTKAGSLLWDGPRDQPLGDMAWYGSARRDRRWNVLKPAPGSEQDVGRLGGLDRSGKTIRTPTFTVGEGPVHSLVRGAGHAYAAVDSHCVINGPLHGQVVVSFPEPNAQLRWITHQLGAYQGHRVHLEFSPHEGHDLEVICVVQGGGPPPLPLEPALAWQQQVSRAESITSVEQLAKSFEQLANEAVQKVAQGELSTHLDHAAMMSWLCDHRELVPPVATTAAPFTELVAARAAILDRIKPASRYAMAMWEGPGEDELLMIRGNPRLTNGNVPRRFLEALGGQGPTDTRGSGRLELAEQLVNPAVTPLVPRVMMNRLWHHLFGRGLAAATDNFGVLGSEPTHPELLDYLAARFVREGWSVKRMIRAIVLSRTYQMASTASDDAAEQADPNNLAWRRTNVRRLEGEAIRDALLTVSGRLNTEQFGPSVPIFLTDFLQGRGRPGSGPLDGNGRRSIYLSVRRNFLSPMLLAFDTPIPFSSMGRRNVSNVPSQALILMNDPFVVSQAELWAKRVLADANRSAAERITLMFEQAFGRPPSSTELSAAEAFLGEQMREYKIDPNEKQPIKPWTDLAHVLFNVKEFIFLD